VTDLRVRLADGTEGILLGNPHTFPGRFNVAAGDGEVITCSLSDIADATPEAAAWLAGYLAGNEPSPYLVFGERADELADDSKEMVAWRERAAAFRATGRWPTADHCAVCGALQLGDRDTFPACGRCNAERAAAD
jgi:hypothetical protein